MGPAIAPTSVPQPYGALNPPPAGKIDPGEWLQAHSQSLTNASQWAQLASWLYDRFVRERPRLVRLSTTRYSRASRETTGSTPFRIEATRQGRVPRVECYSVTVEPAQRDVARRLALAAGDLVVRRENWYYADDEPMQLGITYIPAAIAGTSPLASGEPLGAGGLYGRLAELGHHLARVREQVFVRAPSGGESAGLKMPAGSPVIEVMHTGYDAAGVPFEVTRFVMRADLMGVVYELAPVD
jgi:GntR family transcriptional regulator